MSTNAAIRLDDLIGAAQYGSGYRSDSSRGDDDLHFEGLRRLVESTERHARRGADELHSIRFAISQWVSAYRNFTKDLNQYPEIAAVPVVRPLFIVGFGRTGSTFLHNLLALDPQARAPRLWELWSPSPPPRQETSLRDPRIKMAQRRLEILTEVAPLIRQIHTMEVQGPDECHHMMRHGTHLAMQHDAPEYWEWLKELDDAKLEHLFAHYKLQVQHLLLFFENRRWVSKSLAHLHYFPVLFKVFPDANVVRLHRDPCAAVPSLASLYASLRRLVENPVDPGRVGRIVLDIFADGMRRMIEADRKGPQRQFIDVAFADLVADPIGVVADIYARFGHELSAPFEEAMRRYIKDSQAAAKSRHSYALEEFGLSRDAVLSRSEEYLVWLKDRTGARIGP